MPTRSRPATSQTTHIQVTMERVYPPEERPTRAIASGAAVASPHSVDWESVGLSPADGQIICKGVTTMASTPTEIFSEINSRIAADPAKTAGMNAIYAFDL